MPHCERFSEVEDLLNSARISLLLLFCLCKVPENRVVSRRLPLSVNIPLDTENFLGRHQVTNPRQTIISIDLPRNGTSLHQESDG